MSNRSLTRSSLLALTMALLPGWACSPPAPEPTDEEPAAAAPAAVPGELIRPPQVPWSYAGETGPDRWGSLAPEYAPCAEGKAQSPVALARIGAQRADLPPLGFRYGDTALNLVNDGHTLLMNYESGSMLELNGLQLELRQLHFHGPSEHTLDGEYLPMEIHLVHQDDGGNQAVVAVLVEAGAENRALRPLVAGVPREAGEEFRPFATRFRAADLLPRDRTTLRYEGSLTTPPCNEGVLWLVFVEPISASEEQIGAFNEAVGNNSRPLQQLHGRAVILDPP